MKKVCAKTLNEVYWKAARLRRKGYVVDKPVYVSFFNRFCIKMRKP